ncbi:DUF4434 domain-containing protein [Alteribacillus sp. HJP-4]|uniref:beta-galactosidase n=1 Tax=Alteribacillus sp. HJP-4 TaxID=2775394 RepID=UPI0035CCD92D
MKAIGENSVKLGVCYYPEHWPEKLWKNDYERMKELGFSYVRMAEFAWTIFEPEEGKFSFELFDEAIDLAHECGLKVILGTPTATPPAWLTHKYPEVLNKRQDGVQFQHGMRRHYNYNSSKYRELTTKLVERLAEHYKDHPGVVGWQIDNELNCETNEFYSTSDHNAFRQWIKEKYKSLENLNNAWGAVFWNQTYTKWEQVFLPRPTIANSPNPHQALDEKKFFSDSAISFAELQANIIRAASPTQWVTTNGMFGHLDNHKLVENVLDFYAYDSYPNFGTIIPDDTSKPLRDRKWSWNLSKVRSICSNFAVFEQQSGPGGWVNRVEQPSPKPGQMRLWTYQSIAHGADMILYFRWRTSTKGSEIYWHGINDYHNQPNRRVKEVQTISDEIGRVGEKIFDSKYEASAAIVHDYNNEWDGEMDTWHGPYTKKSEESWFKAFQYNHIPVDSLHFNDRTDIKHLKEYKVLIYPHPAILNKEYSVLLEQFVEQGGTLIVGCRSGYKDTTGQPYMMKTPGYLSELTGVTVEDFTRIASTQPEPHISWNATSEMNKAGDFNEVLALNNSESQIILARFEGTYYDKQPALVKNAFGEGNTYYFGGVFNLEIATNLLKELNLDDETNIVAPENIEVAIRTKNEKKYIFILNYSDESQKLILKKNMRELISDEIQSGYIEIDPFDVFIYETELN